MVLYRPSDLFRPPRPGCLLPPSSRFLSLLACCPAAVAFGSPAASSLVSLQDLPFRFCRIPLTIVFCHTKVTLSVTFLDSPTFFRKIFRAVKTVFCIPPRFIPAGAEKVDHLSSFPLCPLPGGFPSSFRTLVAAFLSPGQEICSGASRIQSFAPPPFLLLLTRARMAPASSRSRKGSLSE